MSGRLDLGTQVRITGNTNGHGFRIGEVVVLDHYDLDGDAVFKSLDKAHQWWLAGQDYEIAGLDDDVHRALATNIISLARALGTLAPSDFDGLNIHELDYQIEDVYTALVRRGVLIDDDIEKED